MRPPALSWIACCLLALMTVRPAGRAADAPAPARTQAGAHITWLGHAAFEVVSPGGTRLLIDPWLSGNERAPAQWRDLKHAGRAPLAGLLVTHSHGDHAQDAAALAALSGAPVVSTGETLRFLRIPEPQQLSVNVGGSVQLGDVVVHVVPAMHSSEPGGRPLGFVLSFSNGRSVYHSGDTWLFGDMALIQELYHPDALLLATGGARYAMDARTAALAVRKYFRPSLIVPMHYGTFPPLAGEAEVRAALQGDPRVRFLRPGESFSL